MRITEDHNFSNAICCYLGRGRGFDTPYSIDEDKNGNLIRYFGAQEAAVLIPKVESVISCLKKIEPTWDSKIFYDNAYNEARDAMKKQYPELTDDAIHALASEFSFWYR